MSRLVPDRIDNRYRGHVLALWLFVPVALQRVALGLTHLLKADGGAQSISTIPLDTDPPAAAQNVTTRKSNASDTAPGSSPSGITDGAAFRIAAPTPAPADGDSVAYCMQRFKSYDPASGTYLGYDGKRHPCP